MPTALLIWRNRALGDTILAIPALRAAVRHGWTLHLVGYPSAWDWLGPAAPRVEPIESAPFDALLDAKRPTQASSLAAALRGVDAALALSVSRDYRTVLRAAGVSRVTQRSPIPPPGIHAADWLRESLLDAIAATSDGPTQRAPAIPHLALSPDELARARRRLAALRLVRPVVLHPGAGCDWKCWPPSRFARLAEALVARGHDVVLTAGLCDGERIAAIQRSVRVPLAVIRDVGPRALAALLALGRCVIGSDCGVSHLAAAVGVPTLAIFGPTDPACWAPRGRFVHVLRKCPSHARSPRQIRVCHDPQCLSAITVHDVLVTLPLLLKEADRREEGNRSSISRACLASEHGTPDSQHGWSDAL